MTRPLFESIVLATTLALVGGCDKGEKAAQPVASAKTDAANTNAEPVKADAAEPVKADDAKTALEPVLARYETIRANLADDKLEGVASDANALAASANEAASKAPAALKSHVEEIESAAKALAGVPASDADALRKQFGEVSKHVVALVSAEPALQEGRHVFECPMAQGYEKWVQKDENLANPYMGKKMLECGAPSKWQS